MSDRELAIEVCRNIGHIMKGLSGITVAITRRYALGTGQETKQTANAR